MSVNNEKSKEDILKKEDSSSKVKNKDISSKDKKLDKSKEDILKKEDASSKVKNNDRSSKEKKKEITSDKLKDNDGSKSQDNSSPENDLLNEIDIDFDVLVFIFCCMLAFVFSCFSLEISYTLLIMTYVLISILGFLMPIN